MNGLRHFLFGAELKVDTSGTLLSFYEVILLELCCMVDSMAYDDLLYKLEIDALICSEYL